MHTRLTYDNRASSILPDSQDPRLIRVLTRYYGVSAETAEELIEELPDRTSLKAIACDYRVAARAVPTSAPPLEFLG